MTPSSTASPTVLLVDDDPVARRALEQALALEGYDVVAEASLATALGTLTGRRPLAAIVDLPMPDGDGPGVVAQLGPYLPPSSVILLTGYIHRRRIEEAVGAGVRALLWKPFDLPLLLEHVTGIVRGPALAAQRAERPVPSDRRGRLGRDPAAPFGFGLADRVALKGGDGVSELRHAGRIIDGWCGYGPGAGRQISEAMYEIEPAQGLCFLALESQLLRLGESDTIPAPALAGDRPGDQRTSASVV
jgi:CheY-like chemotaxis protein